MFEVSGMLWNGVLVMIDRETETLWTQLDGRAICGPGVGARLAHVESAYTTWSRWKALHPDTTVLEKGAAERRLRGSAYAEYFADPERLFLPELAEGLGGKVGPKETVWGIALAGEALAVPDPLLREEGLVNAVVGGVPVAWIHQATSDSVRAVERVLEGRVVVLQRREGRVTDARDGGPIPLERLPAVRVDRAFWYAWRRSHPGSWVLTR